MYWWLKSPWCYFIPRFDRNYEVVDGKVVHGKEAINIGQYYGLFYFDLRWRSAEDGRTPMLAVHVRLFNRWGWDKTIREPEFKENQS
jgi:hypothetical protein